MLFVYKKARLRLGAEGKIARWVAETYVNLRKQYPQDPERQIRIKICDARYNKGELDPCAWRFVIQAAAGS